MTRKCRIIGSGNFLTGGMMNRFERIKELVAQRDTFLAEHPELQPLQDEINQILSKSGSKCNKNVILQQLMIKKLEELTEKLESLFIWRKK